MTGLLREPGRADWRGRNYLVPSRRIHSEVCTLYLLPPLSIVYNKTWIIGIGGASTAHPLLYFCPQTSRTRGSRDRGFNGVHDECFLCGRALGLTKTVPALTTC